MEGRRLWLRQRILPVSDQSSQAIVVGATRHGWYRLYADGELLGQLGSRPVFRFAFGRRLPGVLASVKEVAEG